MLRSPLAQTISYYFFFSSPSAKGISAVRVPLSEFLNTIGANIQTKVSWCLCGTMCAQA
jgi:hypothetical protein